MKEGSAVISQAKFIALALQVILVAAIYETRVSFKFLTNGFAESLHILISCSRHLDEFFGLYESKQPAFTLLFFVRALRLHGIPHHLQRSNPVQQLSKSFRNHASCRRHHMLACFPKAHGKLHLVDCNLRKIGRAHV